MSEPRPFAFPGTLPQYGPDRPLRILDIALWLKPDIDAQSLEAICTTSLEAIDDGEDAIVLDAVDLEVGAVHALSDDGRRPLALAYQAKARTLRVEFGRVLQRRERLTFAVEYMVRKPARGLYFPSGVRQVWTQSQDQDARYWLPCVDYPDSKQTTTTTIIVPLGDFALGNGALVERRDGRETTTFVYRQSVPHATYLFTMVAGSFAEREQTGTSVPTYFYVAPGREAEGERSFGATPKMMQVLADFAGVAYPFERYSQIAVADFIFGGMENTAATTQTDRTLHDERAHLDFTSDPLVSHELAHQWFGDLLTTRDWAHAWLNEGFATYCEAVYREADLGWDEYCYYVYEAVRTYLGEDTDRYRRPIVCNRFRDPIELFDRHLYEKGGAVLHMLRGALGHERFRRSIARYVRDNAGGSVETIDLVRAIERETGTNVRGFIEQWVERGGHPELEIGYAYDEKKKLATITVKQTQTIDAEHPAYRFDLVVGLLAHMPGAIGQNVGDAALVGEVRHTLAIARAVETFALGAESEPALVRVDVGGYVLGTTQVAFGTDMHLAVLRHDCDPIARIRAAAALAKDDARSATAGLCAALSSEPFWGAAVEIARSLGTTHREEARAALIAALDHAHPKVRRAAATALGNFAPKRTVADALLAKLDDPSYFVVGAALVALGKSRDARAYDALIAALNTVSWNETIASAAARGLAELADVRALDHLVAATREDRPEALRRAALASLARLGNLIDDDRPSIVRTIAESIDAGPFLVRLAAIDAAETLLDSGAVAALRRVIDGGDGRLRRHAREALDRIADAERPVPEVAKLRAEVVELREAVERLRRP